MSSSTTTSAGRPSAREFLRASVWRGKRLASHRIASPEHDTEAMQDTTRPEGRAVDPPSSAPGLPPSLSPDEPPRRAPVGTRMNGMGFGWGRGVECKMPCCMTYRRSSAAIFFLNLRNETLPGDGAA